MFRLYSRGGSQEVQILGEVVRDQVWTIEKREVVRLLKSRGCQKAAAILDNTPFELRKGTNEFNDDFCVLYYRVPHDRYVAIADEYEREKDVKLAYQWIAEAITENGRNIRFIVLDLHELTGDILPVANPSLEISSDSVRRALADAQNLIEDRGAASGVDRVHTVFHGYLKVMATEAGIPFKEDSGITDMFKLLRSEHPALAAREPRMEDVDRVLKSMATIVHALNPIRNRASSAHPNEFVLKEPEAMLIINSVNTLLHYLDARLREYNT